MNFDLNDEQKVWKKSVHEFVEKGCQTQSTRSG